MRAWGALAMLVGVQLSVPGLYLPPVSNVKAGSISAPKDHFSACPHCGVSRSGGGCVDGARSCPTVRARSVSPSSVRVKTLRPTSPPHTIISLPVHTACVQDSAFNLDGSAHPGIITSIRSIRYSSGECRQRSVSPSHWASGFLPWPARTPATPLAM